MRNKSEEPIGEVAATENECLYSKLLNEDALVARDPTIDITGTRWRCVIRSQSLRRRTMRSTAVSSLANHGTNRKARRVKPPCQYSPRQP